MNASLHMRISHTHSNHVTDWKTMNVNIRDITSTQNMLEENECRYHTLLLTEENIRELKTC